MLYQKYTRYNLILMVIMERTHTYKCEKICKVNATVHSKSVVMRLIYNIFSDI